jgi:hypothetical protein
LQTITQSALSTQFVQVLVMVTSANGYNPTSDDVSFAFTNASAFPAQSPGDGDWNAGSWATYPGPLYYAQILIGPENGGVMLSQGRWQAWLQISGGYPEVPVLQPFVLQVA